MGFRGTWKRRAVPLTLWLATAGAVTITSPPQKRQTPSITAVSDCHMHGTVQYCMVGTAEYEIIGAPTATEDLPSSYTDCHAHATQTWCMNPNGGEVQVVGEGEEAGTTAAATPTTSITAVTDCHMHETDVYCLVDSTEYRVSATVTATQDLPPSYTGCHSHGSDTYCLSPSGDDVQIQLASEEDEGSSSEPTEENCHFHAGVEHCVGGSGESSEPTCERTDRDYNVSLRIGLLFVILVTSAIGVFAPILLDKFVPGPKMHTALLILKQFGTGVILSTSLVHLFTHAELMFGNECLGELQYEATTAAIFMAGLFLSFLLEYIGFRFVKWQARKAAATQSLSGAVIPANSLRSLEMVSVYVMEAGIIFHSMIIGVTLVVAGDSFFITLFIVIIFHQMFEGLALGSRIAALGQAGSTSSFAVLGHHGPSHGAHSHGAPVSDAVSSTDQKVALGDRPEHSGMHTEIKGVGETTQLFHVSMAKKIYLATAFALVTPIGMAIGIGVLNQFNGNDPQTIVAIGTLDAFSAGILLWVGVVEMWAADWVYGGGMTDSNAVVTSLGLFGLIAGMVLMSFLGKWA